jgi:4-amino-4-deoxy-L-arabinose transferase-like glycosyltransferase
MLRVRPLGSLFVDGDGSRAEAGGRAAPRDLGRILLVAGGTALLLLVVAPRYGYHRDELYFLEAARHLAWGFVDQPPLAPAVTLLADSLLGGSPLALRVLPAVTAGALVVLAGLTARTFGGGRFAQILAALCVATVAVFLGVGHLLSTTTFDFLVWAVVLYLVVRILDGADERLWLVVGVVSGIGLLNKWTVVFLAAGLVIGLLVTPQRLRLASPWPWVGAALALVIWSPNLLWQIRNDWPTMEMLSNLRERNLDDDVQLTFLPLQLLYVGPLLAPIWFAGVRWLLVKPEGRAWRSIAWTFLFLVAFFLATGGKPYYIAPMYVPLLGAGSVAVERWLAGRARKFPSRRAVVAAVLLGAVPGLFISLPILPAEVMSSVPLQEINYDLGETIGWPTFAAQVAAVYRTLPAVERASTVLFTGSYGEAGGLDRFGPALGLPEAYSGHNSYWWWGPRPLRRSAAIAVGYFDESFLSRFWDVISVAGRIDNGIDVDNEEQGVTIWLCRQPLAEWATIWPELRHYN